jgi:hypothetical protein
MRTYVSPLLSTQQICALTRSPPRNHLLSESGVGDRSDDSDLYMS